MIIYRLLLLVCISGYRLYGAADGSDLSAPSEESGDTDNIEQAAGSRAVTPPQSGAGGPSSAFVRSPGRGAIAAAHDKGGATEEDGELKSLVAADGVIDSSRARRFPEGLPDGSGGLEKKIALQNFFIPQEVVLKDH